jgi:hypothetical protein
MQHVLEIVQRTEMLVCPFLALVFMVLLAFKSWQVTLWERNSCFASHAQNIFWLARPIVSTHVLTWRIAGSEGNGDMLTCLLAAVIQRRYIVLSGLLLNNI